MADLPIGSIICFPAPVCPEGYMPCDGRELSKKTYAALYKILGGIFGESSNFFRLPDLRGQFVRGWDNEGNIDPQRQFGTIQNDSFQGHGHGLRVDGEMSEEGFAYETKSITYGTNTFSANSTTEIKVILTKEESKKIDAKRIVEKNIILKACYMLSSLIGKHYIWHKHTLPSMTVCNPCTTTYQTARIDVETRPTNISLLYCIKVK